MLRAIPSDRYSYPHGQCRRWTWTRNISKTNEISVLALVDFSLVEVSTGWAHTTSELKTHIPYPIITLYIIYNWNVLLFFLPDMVMVRNIFWAWELFWLMEGLSKSPPKRLRWETLRKKFFYRTHGVDKFVINVSGAIWWASLQPIQKYHWNQRWNILAERFTQVMESIPWVRCASGNFFFN